MTEPAKKNKWSDLGKRVFSALVLIGFGVGLALASGVWLRLGVSLIIGGMLWELSRLCAWRHPEFMGTGHPVVIAGLGAMALFLVLVSESPLAWGGLLVPLVLGWAESKRSLRPVFVVFAAALMLAGYGLVMMREIALMPFVLWLVGTVILSDILGYFVGKAVGGRKFWPAISPNKTWSGTVAGWVGAVVLALVLVRSGHADPALLIVAPFVAFAGQMGDIAESWLKRRAGVKDSSRLLPGHGGLMDRFDALTGAILAVMLAGALMTLPEVF